EEVLAEGGVRRIASRITKTSKSDSSRIFLSGCSELAMWNEILFTFDIRAFDWHHSSANCADNFCLCYNDCHWARVRQATLRCRPLTAMPAQRQHFASLRDRLDADAVTHGLAPLSSQAKAWMPAHNRVIQIIWRYFRPRDCSKTGRNELVC